MSKLRNFAVSLAAAVALAGGATLTAAPAAEAAVLCMPATPNIHCSMYWANRTNYAAYPGADNHTVAALQRALTQAKFPVTVNGVWGSATTNQLKAYQTSRGLTVTGNLNYKVLEFMRAGAGPKVTVTKATKAVQFAYAQIGKPYVYGATGPSSYDCSGLTGASWKSAGVSLSRTSHQQLSSLPAVSKANLRPGDIVGFYSGSHVGIYVGNGYIIHASRPGTPVAKVPMSQMPFYKAVRPAA